MSFKKRDTAMRAALARQSKMAAARSAHRLPVKWSEPNRGKPAPKAKESR